ncbi:MAG: CHAT domain-containing protein [Bacteroidota bacterium]
MSRIAAILLKTCFLIFGVFFLTSSYAQYTPFWANERNLEGYQNFDDYMEVVDNFNKEEKVGAALEALDSLALIALNGENYPEFLFLKNEVANFYMAESRYGDGYTDLYNAMEVFSNNHDTLKIEYVASQRLLRKMLKRSPHESRGEEELFTSQLYILDELGVEGEPLRNTLVDYGLYLTRQNKINEAINILYDARTQALKDNDLSSLAVADYTIITNLPPVHDNQKTTMEVLKNDIALFEQANPSLPILTYNSFFNYLLGERYYEYFDDIDKGIYYTEKSLACLDTLLHPAWNLKASCHSNLALMHADLKDTTRLLENYRKTKRIADSRPMSDYNKSLAYVNIADAGVSVSADSALVLLDSIKKQPGAQSFEQKIAEIEAKTLIKQGQEKEAIKLITGEFEDFEKMGGHNIPLISDSIGYLKQIQFFELLEEAYKTSNNLIEKKKQHHIVTDLISKQNQLYLKAIEREVYGYELSSLVNKYHDFLMPSLVYLLTHDNGKNSGEIFQLVFSSKALHLYNNLIKNQMQSLMDDNSKLFSQLINNSDDIQTISNQLTDDGTSKAKEKELKKKLNTLLVDNMILRYQMNEKEPLEAKGIQVPTLAEIQEKLNPGEGIVEYSINDTTLIWTLITEDYAKTGLKHVEDLSEKISKEIHAIKTGRQSTGIGEILLGGIENEILNLKHLTVIPDESLSYIPFEWLVLPESKKMLIQHLPVSYNYSASLWHLLKDEKSASEINNVLAVAPLFYNQEQDGESESKAHYTSGYRGPKSFSPLYFTKKEVNTIDSIFSEGGSDALSLFGPDANIKNTINYLEDYDIIHMATHGVINTVHPERSGLFFHPGKESGEMILNDEHILNMGELMSMDLKAQLVVLSACNTGRGQFAEGEGVLALPRGFIFAGVPNVIASLWSVHDERTQELMAAFYSYLLEGNSYSEALRLAKLDSIKKGFLPMDWAGFILIGS